MYNNYTGEVKEIQLVSEEQRAKETKARLETAMKMKKIYEEKQRRWEDFRAAESLRRVEKAKKAELDHLAGVLAHSRARKEYTQLKFKQSLCVRSHLQAVIVIQRSFRALKLRRSWQERVKARRAMLRRKQEREAAIRIQRAWRKYQWYRVYRATHFKPVYTSPVISLPMLTRGSQSSSEREISYKKHTSITGK